MQYKKCIGDHHMCSIACDRLLVVAVQVHGQQNIAAHENSDDQVELEKVTFDLGVMTQERDDLAHKYNTACEWTQTWQTQHAQVSRERGGANLEVESWVEWYAEYQTEELYTAGAEVHNIGSPPPEIESARSVLPAEEQQQIQDYPDAARRI